MKELSIEEKAKAYDKLFVKAQQIYNKENDVLIIHTIEDLFPELAESEDERIRKALIKIVNGIYQDEVDYAFVEDGISYEQLFSWLEKQGEHANFCNKIQIGDKVTRNEDGVLVNLSQLNRVAKKDEKQGEQKPQRIVSAEAKESMYDKPAWSEEDVAMIDSAIAFVEHSAFTTIGKGKGGVVAWLKNLKDKAQLQPQPKQEWSEEDSNTWNRTLLYLENMKDSCATSCALYINECIIWLKSLKKRVQPKQEWSKEDERYLNIVSSVIGSPSVQGIYDYHKVNPTDVSGWLEEHIQPQNRWKPSDEQMEALEHFIVYHNGSTNYAKDLKELRLQLKKLREE